MTLPEGRVAIEASAGTGKTYTLSGLAARFVAEAGVPIAELLIVTFTRAAAAELKDRVRGRLVESLADLDGAPSAEANQQRRRLADAITDFDAATITTIHGFAQQVLGSLGSSVPTDLDAVLVDDTKAIVTQVTTDLLTREAVRCIHPAEDVPDLKTLVDAACLVLANPDAIVVPTPDPATSTPVAALLRTLVDQVVAEVGRRRRAAGTLAFDDLLVALRDALLDSSAGPAARRHLRRRFRVALIDEFQDTDPVQWAIFDALFGRSDAEAASEPTTLVLVGDPKQAIYGFRGADVHTYLDAAHADGTSLTSLDTNYRSDRAMLRSLEVLLDGVTFGDDLIAFQPVRSPEHLTERQITAVDGSPLPTLSLRLVDGPGVKRNQKAKGCVTKDAARDATFADVADHVRDLLETAHIPSPDSPGGTRPLRPDDVAVLISAGFEGPQVRAAFAERGIPAVINRGDDVLDSEAAAQWHQLLYALARPADPRRARAVALSWFVGWDAETLANADDADITAVQEQLHRWAELLGDQGLAAFIGTLRAETGVAARVLARPDGDRAMTDLDHLAELLQLAAARRPSAASLLTTFESLSGGDDQGDPDANVAARRVESEARAVQIMTTFVAKGLEFPVVCCPTLWSPTPTTKLSPVYWDADAHKRTVDVAGEQAWPDEDARLARRDRSAVEALGSNLRVLYVALTRARHHTAVWWAPVDQSGTTGLAQVLFARDCDDAAEVLIGEPAREALAPLVESGDGLIEVADVDHHEGPARHWLGGESPDGTSLASATLDRRLDRARGRWSFTAITSRGFDLHDAGIDPFDESGGDAGAADEPVSPVVAPDEPLAAAPPDTVDLLPLGSIAGGAGFGTLVHEVLERLDFAADDLEAAVRDTVVERLAWNPWPLDVDQLVHGLVAALRTPLGPRFAGRPLEALTMTDRLDEMSFDLLLAPGRAGTGRATDAEIGRVLLEHLDDDDPLGPWARRLSEGPFAATLAGHLTGSIDLVARVRHDDGIDRFVVVDYKTNRLSGADSEPASAPYRPDRLFDAMAAHDYTLQALLYAVALHRYLRWRLADYDPAVHLGGIAYLFVRGMVGPDTPTDDAGTPNGVFSWQPSAELVCSLSDLLEGTGPVASSTEAP